MCRYNKTQVFPYDPIKLAILSVLRPEDDFISNCEQNFKRTVSFDDIVHFIDGENIVSSVQHMTPAAAAAQFNQKENTKKFIAESLHGV